VLVGCANDPVYLPAPMGLEADGDGTQGIVAEAKSQLLLPINLETEEDRVIREARSAELGVQVPYVKLGDIEVSVEWTIKNLLDVEGIALVELDGATEFFEYDPDVIVLSTEDEAPPTPGLEGNIPLHIPANATVSGVFREDQLREASIDLDQITRANANPFAAMLTVNKNDQTIQPFLPPVVDQPAMPDPTATPIPREAFAQIVRVDLVFAPSHHMVLEYTVRVRDVRGEMMNDLLLEAPTAELHPFAIMPYAVGP
jgi:hypothetical protein